MPVADIFPTRGLGLANATAALHEGVSEFDAPPAGPPKASLRERS